MDATEPRIDGEIVLLDGRRLGFAVWGDPEGEPAVLCHGAPASRLFRPDPAVTARLGMRLITADRPGYGRSSPQPGRTFLDWVGDLSQLMAHLGLTSFSIAAHSAGGPYALACASLLPQVRRVVLVSSVAPLDPDAPDVAFSDDPSERELVDRARRDPERARAEIAGAAGWLAEEPDRFLTLPRPEPDVRLLEQAETRTMFLAAVREAVRQGLDGYATDEVLCRRPWGFALDRIGCHVSIWHGARDVVLPDTHGYALAKLLPHAGLHIDPAQGHGLILARWAEIGAELMA
jgi:pimeloyl-ACP methyl ester carboxylesterase